MALAQPSNFSRPQSSFDVYQLPSDQLPSNLGVPPAEPAGTSIPLAHPPHHEKVATAVCAPFATEPQPEILAGCVAPEVLPRVPTYVLSPKPTPASCSKSATQSYAYGSPAPSSVYIASATQLASAGFGVGMVVDGAGDVGASSHTSDPSNVAVPSSTCAPVSAPVASGGVEVSAPSSLVAFRARRRLLNQYLRMRAMLHSAPTMPATTSILQQQQQRQQQRLAARRRSRAALNLTDSGDKENSAQVPGSRFRVLGSSHESNNPMRIAAWSRPGTHAAPILGFKCRGETVTPRLDVADQPSLTPSTASDGSASPSWAAAANPECGPGRRRLPLHGGVDEEDEDAEGGSAHAQFIAGGAPTSTSGAASDVFSWGWAGVPEASHPQPHERARVEGLGPGGGGRGEEELEETASEEEFCQEGKTLQIRRGLGVYALTGSYDQRARSQEQSVHAEGVRTLQTLHGVLAPASATALVSADGDAVIVAPLRNPVGQRSQLSDPRPVSAPVLPMSAGKPSSDLVFRPHVGISANAMATAAGSAVSQRRSPPSPTSLGPYADVCQPGIAGKLAEGAVAGTPTRKVPGARTRPWSSAQAADTSPTHTHATAPPSGAPSSRALSPTPASRPASSRFHIPPGRAATGADGSFSCSSSERSTSPRLLRPRSGSVSFEEQQAREVRQLLASERAHRGGAALSDSNRERLAASFVAASRSNSPAPGSRPGSASPISALFETHVRADPLRERVQPSSPSPSPRPASSSSTAAASLIHNDAPLTVAPPASRLLTEKTLIQNGRLVRSDADIFISSIPRVPVPAVSFRDRARSACGMREPPPPIRTHTRTSTVANVSSDATGKGSPQLQGSRADEDDALLAAAAGVGGANAGSGSRRPNSAASALFSSGTGTGAATASGASLRAVRVAARAVPLKRAENPPMARSAWAQNWQAEVEWWLQKHDVPRPPQVSMSQLSELRALFLALSSASRSRAATPPDQSAGAPGASVPLRSPSPSPSPRRAGAHQAPSSSPSLPATASAHAQQLFARRRLTVEQLGTLLELALPLAPLPPGSLSSGPPGAPSQSASNSRRLAARLLAAAAARVGGSSTRQLESDPGCSAASSSNSSSRTSSAGTGDTASTSVGSRSPRRSDGSEQVSLSDFLLLLARATAETGHGHIHQGHRPADAATAGAVPVESPPPVARSALSPNDKAQHQRVRPASGGRAATEKGAVRSGDSQARFSRKNGLAQVHASLSDQNLGAPRRATAKSSESSVLARVLGAKDAVGVPFNLLLLQSQRRKAMHALERTVHTSRRDDARLRAKLDALSRETGQTAAGGYPPAAAAASTTTTAAESVGAGPGVGASTRRGLRGSGPGVGAAEVESGGFADKIRTALELPAHALVRRTFHQHSSGGAGALDSAAGGHLNQQQHPFVSTSRVVRARSGAAGSAQLQVTPDMYDEHGLLIVGDE